VWLGEVCRDLTALGSHLAVTAAALVVAGALTLRGAPGLAVRLLATLAGAHALAAVLKASVARPRPELVPRLAEVFTASFPSAHALLPAALYPLLAWLCTREAPAPALRRYAVGVALLLVLLVGTSRVVLGVHYATDVLAGWALGAGWTCALWALAGPARRSG
jgi:undecaprenyl-diphosphatase